MLKILTKEAAVSHRFEPYTSDIRAPASENKENVGRSRSEDIMPLETLKYRLYHMVIRLLAFL